MREPFTRAQRIECIVRTLRPTDPGSWDVNVTYVTAEFDSHDAALREQLATACRIIRDGYGVVPITPADVAWATEALAKAHP